MKIQVITLFPDEFRPLVALGVTGRAIGTGKPGPITELLMKKFFEYTHS